MMKGLSKGKVWLFERLCIVVGGNVVVMRISRESNEKWCDESEPISKNAKYVSRLHKWNAIGSITLIKFDNSLGKQMMGDI